MGLEHMLGGALSVLLFGYLRLCGVDPRKEQGWKGYTAALPVFSDLGLLVTTSASGLDPHIASGAALWQAPRIARACGGAVDRIRQVILDYVDGRDLGFLGEPRVNVHLLNLALDRQLGQPTGTGR